MPIFDRESTLRANDNYHRRFDSYMDVPCTKHDALIGEPCWRLPASNESIAVCGRRMGGVR
ncbi:hypothetical protein I6I57_07600 [Brevibacterium casei]|uniref:hypothetical protein n=1 Tax=Brevibacterium casei TaxID=33889 RepID=UPI00191A7A96|nr:hypothetical protein [Brevibacterium casei]QQT70708.1 hypothetical protein I6I57_07600 [Brevibacterium casei]